jgi:hypothetical protein
VPINHFKVQLDHLIELAKLPGWKAHAWYRAQELDADPYGLFQGISEALTQAMKSESEPQPSTKPR